MRMCSRCDRTLDNTMFEFDEIDICIECGDEIRAYAEEAQFIWDCIDPDLDSQ